MSSKTVQVRRCVSLIRHGYSLYCRRAVYLKPPAGRLIPFNPRGVAGAEKGKERIKYFPDSPLCKFDPFN